MKILTVILTFLFLTSFKPKDEIYIWFPHEIGVFETCIGQDIEINIEISTESLKNIKVHSFSLGQFDFLLFKDNKPIALTDTTFLSKNSPLSLKVKYKIQSSEKPNSLSFKTNFDKYSTNQIKLSYGQYLITTSEIRARKEQFINVSESCQDSIKVIFPYGGTVSSAILYSDSTSTKKKIKSVSYHLGGDGNFINFSKSDIGRYYLDFGSCHWGGEFWLTIK
ncbi:hypothetical protein [Flavobacterium filum]|uniref:hypothetical protein n=1 Tax=Flavobacterium filum TaxID=370974 RepID=UPI0023F341C3|nr:hypothetical protein [Flavobacterium filum]